MITKPLLQCIKLSVHGLIFRAPILIVVNLKTKKAIIVVGGVHAMRGARSTIVAA